MSERTIDWKAVASPPPSLPPPSTRPQPDRDVTPQTAPSIVPIPTDSQFWYDWGAPVYIPPKKPYRTENDQNEKGERAVDWRAVATALAGKGRGTDTVLAHLTPREMAILKQYGGSGTVNPDTGLVEFMEAGGSGAVGSAASDTGGLGGQGALDAVGAAGAQMGGALASSVAPGIDPSAAAGIGLGNITSGSGSDVTGGQAMRGLIGPALSVARSGFPGLATASPLSAAPGFLGMAWNAITGKPQENTPRDLLGTLAALSPPTALGFGVTQALNALGIKGDASNVSGAAGPGGLTQGEPVPAIPDYVMQQLVRTG